MIGKIIGFLVFILGLIFYIGNLPPVILKSGVGCIFFPNIELFCRIPKEIPVSGLVDKNWEPLIELFKKKFRDGLEIGAQFTVFHKNKLVVDASVGFSDPVTYAPFEKRKLQFIASGSKLVENLVIAMLVDRGLLTYDTKISSFWPKFGQNGKENVTLAHLMSHGGGVAHFDVPFNLSYFEKNYDGNEEWKKALEENVIDHRGYRPSGFQSYHGWTRGFYASQICRILDPKHRNLDQFAQEEIAKPMKLEKQYKSGLPRSEREAWNVGSMHEVPLIKILFGWIPRFILPKWITDLIYNDHFFHKTELILFGELKKEGSYTKKIWDSYVGTVWSGDPTFTNFADDAGHVEGPSVFAFSNAHFLARVTNLWINNGTDVITGHKFISQKTIYETTTYYPYLDDGWLFFPIAFSKGGFGRAEIEKDTKYFLPRELADECNGWGGAGGSLIQFCPKYNLTFSYVMNYYGANFVNDPRNVPYLFESKRLAKENNSY